MTLILLFLNPFCRSSFSGECGATMATNRFIRQIPKFVVLGVRNSYRRCFRLLLRFSRSLTRTFRRVLHVFRGTPRYSASVR